MDHLRLALNKLRRGGKSKVKMNPPWIRRGLSFPSGSRSFDRSDLNCNGLNLSAFLDLIGSGFEVSASGPDAERLCISNFGVDFGCLK
jgi:hypothetical protein